MGTADGVRATILLRLNIIVIAPRRERVLFSAPTIVIFPNDDENSLGYFPSVLNSIRLADD